MQAYYEEGDREKSQQRCAARYTVDLHHLPELLLWRIPGEMLVYTLSRSRTRSVVRYCSKTVPVLYGTDCADHRSLDPTRVDPTEILQWRQLGTGSQPGSPVGSRFIL